VQALRESGCRRENIPAFHWGEEGLTLEYKKA